MHFSTASTSSFSQKCLPNHKLFYLCQPRNGVYTVGDFMTRKEELRVVKPNTSVDEGTFLLKFYLYFIYMKLMSD